MNLKLQGKFKCYLHEYSCDYKKDWDYHMANVVHTHIGKQLYKTQVWEFSFTGLVPIGKNVTDMLEAHHYTKIVRYGEKVK